MHFRFRIVSDAYVDKLGGISSKKFNSIRFGSSATRASERASLTALNNALGSTELNWLQAAKRGLTTGVSQLS